MLGPLVADVSGNQFTARALGKVNCPADGVCGHCACFDGKSDLTVSQGRLIHLKQFTLAAWINPDSVDGRSGILAKRTANSSAPFVLSVQNGCLGFDGCDETGRNWTFNVVSPRVIEAGRWQHVAAVAREGQGVTLFVNGSQVAARSNEHRFWQNDEDLWIGRDAWAAGRPILRPPATSSEDSTR